MLSENFVWLGLLVGVCGISSYIAATLQGRVKPNRLSWFLLAPAPMIAFAAEINAGVGVRSVMTFWVGFAPLLVFFASFVNKEAYWKLTRFDSACGGLAAVAIVLWWLTGSGNVAIALTVAADALAFLPIFVKSWRFPHTEVSWPFIGATINSSIAMLVLNRWTFADYAFPLYIFLSSLSLVLIIVVRQRVVEVVDIRESDSATVS